MIAQRRPLDDDRPAGRPESAGPGGPPWAVVDPYPLWVQVPAGWWRFFPVGGGGRGRHYVAEFVTAPIDPDGEPRVEVRVRWPSVWGLEERLGWALPLSCHVTLAAARPTARFAAARVTPFDREAGVGQPYAYPPALDRRRVEYRPWRASLVLRADEAPASYGRLGHDERPVHRWRLGQVQLDVVAAEALPSAAGGGQRITYRVGVGDRVVFAAGDDVTTHGADLLPTGAIRAVVATLTSSDAGRTYTLSDRQRIFLADFGRRLADAVRPLTHPYPDGTRVLVTGPADGGGPWTATGTVLAAASGAGGVPVYQVRPDVADLPGHPWAAHPRWAVEAARRQVMVVFDRADANTEAPDGEPGLLATGAVVTAIDDPRFSAATVLRAFVGGDGPTPRYEVQPHDTGDGPIVVAATDVAPRTGTAWPSTHHLLLARADLPLQPFEIILTVRDVAMVADGPHGPYLGAVEALLPVDPALDPAGRVNPVDVAPDTPPSRPPFARVLDVVDGTCRLHHPTLGLLAVRDDVYVTALAAGPDQIVEILTRRPWLPAGPWPHRVAAALAALHAPDDVTALTPPAHPTPPPGGPLPGAGPPLSVCDPAASQHHQPSGPPTAPPHPNPTGTPAPPAPGPPPVPPSPAGPRADRPSASPEPPGLDLP